MSMTASRSVLLAVALVQSASACQVPVFRYALERWDADPFQLVVAHRDPLAPALEKLLLATEAELSATPPPANLELEVLDVTRLSETQQLSVIGLDQVERWPAFLLHPPRRWRSTSPWVLDADAQTLQQILHSPARQRCIDDLLAGESAVWFLIESGDKAADDSAHSMLRRALDRAHAEIEIPEGVVRREDLDVAGNEVNLDDVLRSSIPLRISFKIELLSRNDPAEQVFLKFLAGPPAKELKGPVIVPVFGRGRSPGPVAAASLSEERIIAACAYLCGACSCQVKSGNPGYDLLFRAPWQEHLQEGLVVIDRVLPPLPGVGELSEKPRPPESDPGAKGNPGITPLWWIAGAIILLALTAGTLLLRRSAL